MAVTEMLQALEAEATARFERIRRRAEEEAREVTAAAEERRRPLVEEAMDKARTTLVAERARRLARARFAVRKEVTLAKEALIDEVFRTVQARLPQARRLPSYPLTFRRLLEEARQGVKGSLTVLVHPDDASLATATLAELGVEAALRAELDTAGGLQVEVEGGRVVVDNTFEGRLSKAERFLRPEVNQRLSGRQQHA